MTSSDLPPSPSQQAHPGGRAPRLQHIPQRFQRGGWTLAALVALCAIGWWLCLASFGVLVFLTVIICWAIFFVDVRGFSSLAGRHPWAAASIRYTLWMTLGFIFVPELLIPVCLWLSVKDHVLATNFGLREQVGVQWRRFLDASHRAQLGIVSVALVTIVIFCSLSSVALAAGQSLITSTANVAVSTNSQTTRGNLTTASGSGSGQIAQLPAPTATTIPTALPTATMAPPTATPIPPTPSPVPPTPTSKPAPANPPTPTGVNGNPWGYEFTSGSVIYNPPANFCNYFTCIPSFWKSTNGYVEECQDGDYSHSGGRSGSCSYHGGNWRPLLQP